MSPAKSSQTRSKSDTASYSGTVQQQIQQEAESTHEEPQLDTPDYEEIDKLADLAIGASEIKKYLVFVWELFLTDLLLCLTYYLL